MPPTIYQLKVSLDGVRPEIWRRIQVPHDISLERLHKVLQCVMGWEDYHLYGFFIDGEEYGDPATNDFGSDVRSARRAKLSSLIDRVGEMFSYRYDFGDDWEHRIILEAIAVAEPTIRYPRCLDGQRSCPPEDCGGIYGYTDLLEAIRDPRNEDHDRLVEWVGEDFDPERFDVALVNAMLVRSRLSRVTK